MNQKLTSQLQSLADNLTKAESADQIQAVIAEVENAVLRSNLENHQNGSMGQAVSRDYVVGEPNTRGLSWKLNLLRAVAKANFCRVVRIGVHGGNVRVLGTEENLDTTFQIYDALVARYEELSKTAFQEFSDSQDKAEDGKAPHRVGWVNQFLQDAPNSAFNAVAEQREGSMSSKTTAMIEANDEQLTTLQQSFAPAKPEKTPKPRKAKAEKNGTAPEESSETPQEMSAEERIEAASASAD